jgi:hypothetical protein
LHRKTTMTDIIGYIVVFGIFFGIPFALVGYGAYVAAKRGVRGQPEELQEELQEEPQQELQAEEQATSGSGSEKAAS